MSAVDGIVALLQKAFAVPNMRAALEHFQKAVDAFQKSQWEVASGKLGKFIEATLKALYIHIGKPLPSSRQFKVDTVIQALGQTPQGHFDDSIRLTIPRACRFGYDIASNRGARHDPDEIDPNQMDATVLIALCAWILAEMIRFAQKGAVQPDLARELVNRLVLPRYPLIENVDGRAYFHAAQSPREVALMLLHHEYPNRLHRKALIEAICRHDFSRNAAQVAVTRLRRRLDDDGKGNLSLLAPGRQEAEQLVDGAGHPERRTAGSPRRRQRKPARRIPES